MIQQVRGEIGQQGKEGFAKRVEDGASRWEDGLTNRVRRDWAVGRRMVGPTVGRRDWSTRRRIGPTEGGGIGQQGGGIGK